MTSFGLRLFFSVAIDRFYEFRIANSQEQYDGHLIRVIRLIDGY